MMSDIDGTATRTLRLHPSARTGLRTRGSYLPTKERRGASKAEQVTSLADHPTALSGPLESSACNSKPITKPQTASSGYTGYSTVRNDHDNDT